MANIFRKHQKRIVKVFGVALMSLLMIVFILPEDFGRADFGPNRIVGYYGDTEFREGHIFQSRREWDLLKNIMTFYPQLPYPVEPGRPPFGYESIVLRLEGQIDWQDPQPLRVIDQIEQHPHMYYLLQQEARQMGVRISQERLDMEMQQIQAPRIDLDHPDNRAAVGQALANFLLVEAAFARAAAVVKISEPLLRNTLAEQAQMVRLNLVEIDPADFADRVEQPTPEQLQEQFERYGDVEVGVIDPETNPLGFGYRFPNRVSLQFIALPREQIREAVLATREPHDWEVAARRHLRENEALYVTEQPPPLPRSPFQIGIIPPLAVNPTPAPRVQWFWEARDAVMDRLTQPQVDRLADNVLNHISTTMNADWSAYRAPLRDRQEAPSTAFGVPYDSYDYLQQLAADVQQRFNVLPTVHSLAELKSARDLAEIPGLGQAQWGEIAFPEYITTFTAPFVPEEHHDHPNVLHIMQPTPPLRDDQTVYFARVTQAAEQHRPEDLREVAEQVEGDWRLMRQYDMAREQAQQLHESTRHQRLSAAAREAGLQLRRTGWFRQGMPVPDLPLDLPSYVAFIQSSFQLLTEAAATGDSHPATVIELPAARKVVVVELDDVRPLWSPEQYHRAHYEMNDVISRSMERPLRVQWFDFENLTARMAYRPHEPRDREPEPADPAPGPPPRTPIGR